MKILRVSIQNFRSFQQLDLPLGGQSVYVIGENASGKTSLLTAIARALGRDLSFAGTDFRDIQQPIEIQVTLQDFAVPQRALFGDYIHFGTPATLTVGVRAIWDPAAENAEVEHWYPGHAGSRSKKREREGLSVQWLGSARDPARMLQFGVTRNLMGLILSAYTLDQSLDQAVVDVRHASEQLGHDDALVHVLRDARDRLAQLLPDVSQDAFAMGISTLSGRDLLRQLELQIEHPEEPVAVGRQSSGVAHLAVFVFALQLAAGQPGNVLLIDEPEISLHPQSQRALMRSIRSLNAQTIIATHSSNLLERADPRMIVRLRRNATQNVTFVRPTGLSEADAKHLARNTRPHTTEAFFARAVILVEGLSDQYALQVLADRRGRNLDAEGVSIVPIGGATAISTYMRLFGPAGFDLSLAGLCDDAEERVFRNALSNAGHTINGRLDMEQLGFFVCVADLEDELIRALGAQETLRIITQEGDLGDFQRLQQQPTYESAALEDQVHVFIAKHKIAYAPLLVEALDLTRVPAALDGVLTSV